MRRLPVFFLIDVSESMSGAPIANVNKGIQQIAISLKNNPMALETAYIAVIIFAGKAKLLVPLTELLQFSTPEFYIGGGTALGNGLNFLMDEMDKQVQKTTHEEKGDWKPIIFLLTDGAPTDDVTPAISRWHSNFRNNANLIAISIGNQADPTVLKKITGNVIIFDDAKKESYSMFFNWISASIETKSMNVTVGNDDFQLPKMDHEILRKEEIYNPKIEYDERYAILLSRCQQTKKPYLIKYLKEANNKYILDGTYSIGENYFELSSEGKTSIIGTESITSIPPCPECGCKSIAYCVCGHLFCIANDGKNVCPWCNNVIQVRYSSNFNISKTQG